MLKKYYAKGNSVVLSGKAYKHGKQLPKRKEGAYDCLVDNNMATVSEEKAVFKASAADEVANFKGMPEDWGDAPANEEIVNISAKVSSRGKK